VASPKRITSAVYAVFTVLAGFFVVSSTSQIAVAVFEEPAPGAPFSSRPDAGDPVPPSVKVPPACAEGLRTLAAAVDRGLAAAAGVTDWAEAEKRYQAARSPEWGAARQRELVQPCTSDARGADAVAAITRFDRAAVGALRHQTDELGPVRRAALSFIR